MNGLKLISGFSSVLVLVLLGIGVSHVETVTLISPHVVLRKSRDAGVSQQAAHLLGKGAVLRGTVV